MAQLMRSQLETYPNQLRRLIAGAVLAFGCYQGLLLRRQCAVACWRLVTIQEYEPIPSVTSCKRARAQLSLSAGKTPVSATHHPIHPAKQPSILLSAAHHLAFSSQASCSQQPLIRPSSTNNQAFNSRPANSDKSSNSDQSANSGQSS